MSTHYFGTPSFAHPYKAREWFQESTPEILSSGNKHWKRFPVYTRSSFEMAAKNSKRMASIF